MTQPRASGALGASGAAPGPLAPSRGLFVYLGLTAALCGALVMVIEVMGARVIGPFFGVSLFVWTAMITVTLVALAAGYAVGGWLADRRGSADLLYGLILLSGIAALAVPLLKAPVLVACAPLGLRVGALLASLALFGPCLFLLGCVSPFVVRLAVRGLDGVGRTVGRFYALSTLGSFVGTVATGFYLIAYLGVRGVFLLAGGLLLALAAGYFALFRRALLALVALVGLVGLAVPFVAPGGGEVVSALMANGTRVTRLFERHSFYGDVQVLEYSAPGVATREMVIDGLVQGGVDAASGLSVYEYSYFLEQLAWGMRPGGGSCLVVGLGAGVIPTWFAERGVACDVVDINPDVVEAARAYFGFRTAGEIVLADARRFLSEGDRRYDYVVLDVFTGDTTPGHLLTVEAMRLVKHRVASGGLLAVNLIGALGQGSLMTASIVRTMGEVFDTVRLFPAFDPESEPGFGNLAVIAHDGPPLPFDRSLVATFPVHPMARANLARYLGREYSLPSGTPALLLTDDYNPIDFHDRWLKESLRREILRGTDWKVLL